MFNVDGGGGSSHTNVSAAAVFPKPVPDTVFRIGLLKTEKRERGSCARGGTFQGGAPTDGMASIGSPAAIALGLFGCPLISGPVRMPT